MPALPVASARSCLNPLLHSAFTIQHSAFSPLLSVACALLFKSMFLSVAAQQRRPTGSQTFQNPCESGIIRGENDFSGRKGWVRGQKLSVGSVRSCSNSSWGALPSAATLFFRVMSVGMAMSGPGRLLGAVTIKGGRPPVAAVCDRR